MYAATAATLAAQPPQVGRLLVVGLTPGTGRALSLLLTCASHWCRVSSRPSCSLHTNPQGCSCFSPQAPLKRTWAAADWMRKAEEELITLY